MTDATRREAARMLAPLIRGGLVIYTNEEVEQWLLTLAGIGDAPEPSEPARPDRRKRSGCACDRQPEGSGTCDGGEERKPTSSEPTYPCAECGVLRTKAEGGTTFTVCDECWDKAHPLPMPSDPPREGGGV